jgi:hypothetical protein
MNQMNVYQRIHAVMNEVGTVAKKGRNDFHKYDYATEADFVHAMRPLLQKHGLVITPKIGTPTIEKDEKGNFLATAQVEFTITNIDKPSEQVVATVLGQGTDKGDKAVYKLMTGAKKYFLALTFMVATGDDPEQDEAPRTQVKKTAKSSAPFTIDDF